MKINETTDYKKFTFVRGNRVVNHNHVKALAKAMEKEDLHDYDPIIVNEKFQIIDGQHRVLARELLKRKVYYFMIEKNGRSDLSIIQNLNSNQKNWTYEDTLRSYCELGNKEYQLLAQFIKTFGFYLTSSICILCDTCKDGGVRGFKEGQFKIKNMNVASENAKKIIEYGKFYPSFKRRSFVAACIRMFHVEQFSHKRMVEKMEYLSTKLVNCPDAQSYLKLLEEIYNYKQSPATKLRFI